MSTATLINESLAAVDPRVQGEAQRLVKHMSDGSAKPLALSLGTAYAVVPELLSRELIAIIEKFASGMAVTVSTVPEELTTTTAAAAVGVSRPTLMKMIQRGEIDAYKFGTHTRLKRSVVAEYVAKRSENRAAALERLLQDGEDYPN